VPDPERTATSPRVPKRYCVRPADLGQDLFELRAAVIHRGSRHRLEDARMHLDGSREEERARSGLDHARTMDREAINDSSSLSITKEATIARGRHS